MIDFTSALYLGLTHDAQSVRPWQQFTTGRPAALRTFPGTRSLAADLATLTGCEAATLGPSTLHLFLDLFQVWPARSTAIHMDGGLYEIGKWGVERAAARGMVTRRFRHYSAAGMAQSVRRTPGRLTPVVVADGFCPCCGRTAPVAEYLECLGNCGGWLVLDDTQALGILGSGPGPRVPFGKGGGGTMRWLGLSHPRTVLVSSLSKGFGVPVAMVGGSGEFVERFEQASLTRVHCSGIPAPSLHAAEQALAWNEHGGDRARTTLAHLVERLRGKAAASGTRLTGGLFPVQSAAGLTNESALELYQRLERMEIQTVLQSERITGAPRVGMLVTARHTNREIDRLGEALTAAPMFHDGSLKNGRKHARPNI